MHLSNQRIERNEQRVRRHGVRLRQAVEERGLAGVRVADQRHRRHLGLLASLAQLRTALPHLLDVVTEGLHPRANPAAIRFELRFAGSLRADATTLLRQRRTGADQARQQVLQLRQLHLQLTFPCPGATREDVENDLGAIEHLDAEHFADLAQLRWCQFVVEDNDVDIGGRA